MNLGDATLSEGSQTQDKSDSTYMGSIRDSQRQEVGGGARGWGRGRE